MCVCDVGFTDLYDGDINQGPGKKYVMQMLMYE